MNVSLAPELEKFITEEIKSGKYSSAEEVIREGLRLLKEHKENGKGQKEEARPMSNARMVKPVTAEKEWRWIREHREEYRGQWVALDGDKLVNPKWVLALGILIVLEAQVQLSPHASHQ